MDLFFWDIETVGEYKDFESFFNNDHKGSNLFRKKYTKMNWDQKYNDINNAYLDNAGIISTYGKIVCISFGFIDKGQQRISSFYGDDEKDIVNKFNELLKKIEKKNFSICGFRIKSFDIPWLLHKLYKYGIEPASIIITHDKKPWEMRVTDISDDWRGKFAWAYSFDEVCYQLGVESPKDNMNGSEVHVAYYQGRIEDIKRYCESDVRASIEVSELIY